MSVQYGIAARLDQGVPEAIETVTAALAEEGFGVLTRIDVQATLKEKLGEDTSPYVILGACNPQLAHRGLAAETELGLLLPCNVVVYEGKDGKTVVSAVDPDWMLGLMDNDQLPPIAAEARQRLERAIGSLA